MQRSSDDWKFLRNWKERLPYMDSDFQFIEPVLALRSSVLHGLMCRSVAEVGKEAGHHLDRRRKVEELFGLLTDTLLTQAHLAREASSYQVSWAPSNGRVQYGKLGMVESTKIGMIESSTAN